MVVAQQLYEGVELSPGEPSGLITYMRTDSIRIAEEAALEAQKMILDQFGESYGISEPRIFKNKNKAQDAHEAIRPTSVYNTPEKLAPHLSKDQLALYTLIWKRFMASQMAQALIDQKSVAIRAGAYTFNVSGSTVKFPGFMTVYISSEDTIEEEQKKQPLPDLSEGLKLKLHKLSPKQHFTQPPPRFSEASLVKELEENGIGRPSTYATILTTIRDKGYVELINRYFKPSELGFIVNDLLVENFPDILDVEFTAKFENNLDRIEIGELPYLTVLKSFYDQFSQKLESAKEHMLSIKGVGVPTDLTCPDCGKKLHIKVGKNGLFLACNGYPECSYSRNFIRDEKGNVKPVEPSFEIVEGKICDKCQRPMVLKQGRYGEFLACSGYPDCKNTQSLNGSSSGTPTGVKCPEDACEGELLERKSRKGKIFYSCSRYPDCSYATWDRPVNQECPQCGAKFLVEKKTKYNGSFWKCLNQLCVYMESR